jgi:glyoxylase-like metal-dependent hydrolase (beta-lactamase superfamily II)
MSIPGIVTIDCDYLRPRFAASYLVHNRDEALFIDNNTAHSVPLLLQALSKAGLSPEQVKYIVITHVHLDHSGGSSLLMKECPRAQLLAHPRAAPHVIDPSRLIKGAQAVYGIEQFFRLYGAIEAIPAERVRAVADGEEVQLGEKKLRFFFTRGHANHHMCVELSENGEKVVFTGDAFGLAYPDLQNGGLFIFPSTSPTDFDAEEARKSVEMIVATGASQVFPTHFGGVKDLVGARKQLLEMIDFSEKLLDEARHLSLPDADLAAFCEQKIRAKMGDLLKTRGIALQDRLSDLSNVTVSELLKLDIELNAQGLAHVAVKRRRPPEQEAPRDPKEKIAK